MNVTGLMVVVVLMLDSVAIPIPPEVAHRLVNVGEILYGRVGAESTAGGRRRDGWKRKGVRFLTRASTGDEWRISRVVQPLCQRMGGVCRCRRSRLSYALAAAVVMWTGVIIVCVAIVVGVTGEVFAVMARATNATTTIATVMGTGGAATIPHTHIHSRHAATGLVGALDVVVIGAENRVAVATVETIASLATSDGRLPGGHTAAGDGALCAPEQGLLEVFRAGR